MDLVLVLVSPDCDTLLLFPCVSTRWSHFKTLDFVAASQSLQERKLGKILWIRNSSRNWNHTFSGVKLFFLLTFLDACQRTHTPACVCVCVRDYFGLLLRAHSCHVCLTALCHQIGPAGFYFFLKNFPGPSRNGCSHSAAAASELWISHISINRKQQDVACLWFTAL